MKPILTLAACLLSLASLAADGNRLVYLDELNPYYVSRTFPKLTTPQWIGEDGVEAVVILSIDDMRDPKKYEAFIRPILERLKQIDGRAPFSILTCRADATDERVLKWLKEGVSIDVHTLSHPCPLLAGGNFAKAKADVDGCIELLNEIPGNKAVAYRMPCCDGRNTLSPRFFAEIFNAATPKGQFLTADSSVVNIFTSNDPALPREITIDGEGKERFRRYFPSEIFSNTIEDYPYPYVIGKLCWEFPFAVPSDYNAQVVNKPVSPRTLEDWKAALDATVIKQGVLTLCFHPHGWSSSRQFVELVDYAAKKYGKKVKFLNFREAVDKLTANLCSGVPLRAPDGTDNGVRLLDLNEDGYLDVAIGNKKVLETRIWLPKTRSWATLPFPTPIVSKDDKQQTVLVRFGALSGSVQAVRCNDQKTEHWTFQHFRDGNQRRFEWEATDADVLPRQEENVQTIYFRDLDNDGKCEWILSAAGQTTVAKWNPAALGWEELFSLPKDAQIATSNGKDTGLRFVDVNSDGFDDILFSNDERYSLHIFVSMKEGWSKEVFNVKRDGNTGLPPIVRKGTNNGVWFHSGYFCIQNENIEFARYKLSELAKGVIPPPETPAQPKPAPAATPPPASTPPPPRKLDDALKCFHVHPGFEIECVGSEPLVGDPIAFDWSADGKFYVVEMGDYPLGVNGKGKFGGCVKLLQDTDGDGRFDKATIFLENLGFPTGVLPWKKGVLITCAPDIFYAEDSDGDGKADVRETLYTGFGQGNQQHRVNGLSYGLDNWIYGANGDSGGKIKSIKTGEVVDIRGRDFRIRPDEGLIETQTGQTQFGRARDDWGNWFGCNNAAGAYHFALDDHYLRRNPNSAPGRTNVTLGIHALYPTSTGVKPFSFTRNYTSACSVLFYRDDLFGSAFANSYFLSEPSHNLIHRQVLSAKGATFSSQRAADEPDFEFVSSSDNWFRPTTIKIGPDGALWIADMYRLVIEHPEWIPKDVQQALDLRAGSEIGRIYRVAPKNTPRRAIPRLDRLATAELVAALDSPNGWQRDNAQRLLVERKDNSAVPLLEKLATESKRQQCRLQALCALDGLGSITPSTLLRALKDNHSQIRRHAIRLSEPLFERGNVPNELADAVTMLAGDGDAHVNVQLAYSLGHWDDPRAARAIGKILINSGNDPFVYAATISSVNKSNLEGAIATYLPSFNGDTGHGTKLLALAARIGDDKTILKLFETICARTGGPRELRANKFYAQWQFVSLTAMLDAFENRNIKWGEIFERTGEAGAPVRRQLQDFFVCSRLIFQKKFPEGDPFAGLTDLQFEISDLLRIPLLGRQPENLKEDFELLCQFTAPGTATELRDAAIARLGTLNNPEVPQILLANWKSFGVRVRSQVLDILSRRPEWVEVQLDAIEKGTIAANDLDAVQRQRLLQHSSAKIRERAAQLLKSSVNPDREKVYETFRPALTLQGDVKFGEKAFTERCATCHKLGSIGTAVGPSLDALTDNSPQVLLIAMLDPNRAVDPRYINYTAKTKDGVAVSGVLETETSASVSLVEPGGKRNSILRTDLANLTSTGVSTMPEGLEAGLQPQDLANVIAFIRSHAPKQKPKTFPGNSPDVVRSWPDGTVMLLTSTCEIFGKTLVLEKRFSNLGYWSSEDDSAAWEIDVGKAGKYAVWFEYACEDGSAGNLFTLQCGAANFTGKVAGTGTWENYRYVKTGELQLEAGRQRLSVRPAGKISNALMDLRSVKLSLQQ